MLVVYLEPPQKPARTGVRLGIRGAVEVSELGVLRGAGPTHRHEAPSPGLAARKVFPRRREGFPTPRAMPDFFGEAFLVEEEHFAYAMTSMPSLDKRAITV